MTNTNRIPTTREAAIAALVEQDVAKWGEGEREASQRMHAHRSLGLALNELWARSVLRDAPDADLKRAAKAALTAVDRAALRQGG
jgi:hypothetical protein